MPARALRCAAALLAVTWGTSGLVRGEPALAHPAQESILMDDAELVYEPPAAVDATMRQLRDIGVDRVRVSLYWSLVAPAPRSQSRPQFGPGGAASPDGYPAGAWDRYDTIVKSAARHGLGVLFTITSPAPSWATGTPGRDDIEDTYEPNPGDFRDFVTAVGRRYSGTHEVKEVVQGSPDPGTGGILGIGGTPAQPPPTSLRGTGEILPRVDHWSIWNEPNHGGWLTPQWRLDSDAQGGYAPAAPQLYRKLVDAAWEGLHASGHGGDIILLGETAPRGLSDRGESRGMRPLEFIRELYCADAGLRAFRQSAANARDCPSSAAERQAFVSEHPALFQASGWAHHPYAFEAPPSRSDPVPDHVVLADINRLVRTLDALIVSYGQRARLPIHLTEYGYQTNPPDPYAGISWRRQAMNLEEAEYMAYRNPRIRSSAQFLLKDDGPFAEFPSSDRRYWGSFQTGLMTNGGRPKHSFDAYQRPIHVTPARARRGRAVRVFGMKRNGRHGATLVATVQYRRRGSRVYTALRRVVTRNERGYANTRVRVPSTGDVRIAWTEEGRRGVTYSRPFRVTVR